jgi:uncharacterized protein with PIN domain
MLIDTSVLVALFKDRTGVAAHALRNVIDGRDYCLTRFALAEACAVRSDGCAGVP